jgi:hypothetical protein
MICRLPHLAKTKIESNDPIMPVVLMMMGKIFSNLGNMPSIKSPEYWITVGPPRKGC